MHTLKAFLAASALLPASCDAPKSASETGPTCSLQNWHAGQANPPRRVLVWKIDLMADSWRLNGKRVQKSEMLAHLQKSRHYRPSPYVMLALSRGTSCEAIQRATTEIDEVFGCRVNYCYYVAA